MTGLLCAAARVRGAGSTGASDLDDEKLLEKGVLLGARQSGAVATDSSDGPGAIEVRGEGRLAAMGSSKQRE